MQIEREYFKITKKEEMMNNFNQQSNLIIFIIVLPKQIFVW